MNATKLREVLSRCKAFLRERHLAPERRVPHLVRWIDGSLTFGDAGRGEAEPDHRSRMALR